jgi:hypothetical protein
MGCSHALRVLLVLVSLGAFFPLSVVDAQQEVSGFSTARLTATDVNTPISTPTPSAYVSIENTGAAAVYFTIHSLTAVADDPCCGRLDPGQIFSTGAVRVRTMGFICDTGETTDVQVIMMQGRP